MKKILLIAAGLFLALAASAQVDDDHWFDDGGWIDQSDYDSFSQQAENKYNSFRDSINQRFARALEGQWHPFDVSAPVERPHLPEPVTPPVAPKQNESASRVVNKPIPTGQIINVNIKNAKEPRQLPAPETDKQMSTTQLSFFGSVVTLELPSLSKLQMCRLSGTDERSVSKFWKSLSDANLQSVINRIMVQQQVMHLNDWGLYEMTLGLSRQLFPDNNDAQAVATVFLLNQMEYDARVARTEWGMACLLAIEAQLYSVPFLTIDNTRYYIFMPDGSQNKLQKGIYTYDVRFYGASLALDMRLTTTPKLQENFDTPTTSYGVGDKWVSVAVNRNLLDFYSNYPQLELSYYADAAVDASVASEMERQFSGLISGCDSPKMAVETLLHFVQYGFAYATDDEQFGYEKPFFVEENFFYPHNDCEDRAILLAWLVRHLVGLDVVLLHYPNHLSMAVCFKENVAGTYVEVDGRRYIECDPTYIGAEIGETQPDYIDARPEVILLSSVK